MFKIFDFKCDSCNTVVEKFTKPDTEHNCEKCGEVMKRAVSAPGMVKTNFADKTGFKAR